MQTQILNLTNYERFELAHGSVPEVAQIIMNAFSKMRILSKNSVKS